MADPAQADAPADDSYPESWSTPAMRKARNSPTAELQRGAEDWLAALPQKEFDDVIARTRQPKQQGV